METDSPKSFVERQRDAALDEWRRIGARDHAVADIVRGTSRRVRSGEVVVVEDGDGATTGAFVAEAIGVGGTVWYAVSNGVRLPVGWMTKPEAILHLLADRYGERDPMGAAVRYAERVLGIQDGER